jgi:hypothetical protein
MMNILSAVLVITFSIINGEEINAPGRCAIWSPASGLATSEYQTQSVGIPQLNQLLNEKAINTEIVALFKASDERLILAHSSVKDSIRQSSSSLILPNIYHTEIKDTQSKIIDDSSLFKNMKEINLASFVQILESRNSATVGPMNNGVTDVYQITLSGHETEHESLKLCAELASKAPESRILFVAIEEPGKNAKFPVSSGNYNRILSTASSSNIDGIYYKPEGGEYSIYYANTYLYITPDIFTGIMTSIFVFFVLLTGYSCLGAIQGNSCYPTKMPVLGREA